MPTTTEQTAAKTYPTYTDWAFARLGTVPRAVSRGERAVLLLAAAHADTIIAQTGRGTATFVSAAAHVLGYAESTLEGFVSRLVARGLLEHGERAFEKRTFRVPATAPVERRG